MLPETKIYFLTNIFTADFLELESQNRYDKRDAIIDKFVILPDDIKALMASRVVAEFLRHILMRRYRMPIEQVSKIAVLIRDVIFGDVVLGSFIQELAKKLNIDLNLAKEIGGEINRQIFTRIAPFLSKPRTANVGAQNAPVGINQQSSVEKKPLSSLPLASPASSFASIAGKHIIATPSVSVKNLESKNLENKVSGKSVSIENKTSQISLSNLINKPPVFNKNNLNSNIVNLNSAPKPLVVAPKPVNIPHNNTVDLSQK